MPLGANLGRRLGWAQVRRPVRLRLPEPRSEGERRSTMPVFPRPLRRALLIACLLLPQLSPVKANAVIVHGRVTDPLGAVVAGAAVTLVYNGKVVTSTHSDATGQFTLSSGVAGRFFVLAGGPSFRQVTTHSFYAGKLDSVEQDVVLEADTVRQSIVVTASGLPMPQAQTGASVDVLH